MVEKATAVVQYVIMFIVLDVGVEPKIAVIKFVILLMAPSSLFFSGSNNISTA